MQETDARTSRHAELAEFLLSRRTRLLPENFCLPAPPPAAAARLDSGAKRSAPWAGISTAYYTWIEQGRIFDVSIDVLDAIAVALRLSEIEAAHVFTLAGKAMQRSIARRAGRCRVARSDLESLRANRPCSSVGAHAVVRGERREFCRARNPWPWYGRQCNRSILLRGDDGQVSPRGDARPCPGGGPPGETALGILRTRGLARSPDR